MQVVRCLAIEPDQAIRNIFVDESNQKWVGNGSMVYQVKALDLATPLALNPGEQSLLSIAGGNADIRWNVEKLQSLLKIKLSADNRLTTGYYDAQKDLLLIGTSASGFFELKTKPSLQLLSSNTTANSKVRSNNITTIYRDSNGKIWIGTENGLNRWLPGPRHFFYRALSGLEPKGTALFGLHFVAACMLTPLAVVLAALRARHPGDGDIVTYLCQKK